MSADDPGPTVADAPRWGAWLDRWGWLVPVGCAVVVVAAWIVGGIGSSGGTDGEAAEPVVVTTPSGEIRVVGPPDDDTLRFAMVGLAHLDPAFVLPADQSGMVAADLLFDGLTAWDPETQGPVPALATWEADETLTRWTFTLRDGATFSDGSPVTAPDVVRSLERVAALGNITLAGVRLDVVAGYREVAAGATDDLTGVSALDDRRVEIVTAEAYAPLPALLSSPLYGIVPAGRADTPEFDQTPVGSGPYALARRDGPVLTLDARDGADVPAPRVELVVLPDADAAYAAFGDGAADWSVVPAGELDEAIAAHGDRAVTPLGATLVYGFNLNYPAFTDVRMRSAVAKAIDREALLASPLESGRRLDGAIPAGVPGAVDDACGGLCSYDPVVARALVQQVFPDGNVPTLELDVYDDPVVTAVADQVAADLAEVGIPTTIVSKPFAEYQGFVVSGVEQLFTFGWVAPAVDPDLYTGPLYLADAPDNVTGYADAVTDLAIKTARAEPDQATRYQLYGEIDRQVMRSVPVVPLTSYMAATVVGERVETYQGRPDGTFVVGRLTLR